MAKCLKNIAVGLTIAALNVAYHKIMMTSGNTCTPTLVMQSNTVRNTESVTIFNVILEQRNNLSKILNKKQQEVGQEVCKRTNRTSKTGGWCLSQSKGEGGQHRTDKNLVTALIKLLKGKSIGSFGDGPGLYKQFFLESNEINVYDAYDGAPFCEITSNGRVKFLDLTLPQYGLPIYDWILSIEVAEHIPKEYESVYISNIVRHAREGVILSWARPGQSGYSHINNRPFLYVKDLMKTLGFTHDEKKSDMLKSATGFRYLRYNLNVYRRLIPPDVLQL
ncbi:uncharacterized protein LOC128557915 [Mercenaria mercenaria]|uniref:uncharacterized protein LOC128557915 n=1 Tax=Mercenaria mercenaria TaxID=6596 RepID=UPI00234FA071|nr:uncharacterized protein LOC128557915 [Mercenaria mercenaria]